MTQILLPNEGTGNLYEADKADKNGAPIMTGIDRLINIVPSIR